tara:strand:- start:438 stop:602 length:165 start_codon:yes stop_codon:yes gene_type:complete
MVKIVKKGKEDYMGFMWFEIFKNNKTTNQYFHAVSEEHVMDMIDEGVEPDLVSY